MKITDSHIHFWQPGTLSYPWLGDVPAINKPYLPKGLPASGDGWEMEKLVFVQADCIPEQGLDEVTWVTELSENDPRIQGIVAFAPLENDNFQDTVKVLGSNPLVKGVRRLIQSEPQGFAVQEHFVRAVNTLAHYALTFDICVLHYQLPDAIALVRQCPNVTFVLDHLGKPNIKDGEIDEWKANIDALAALDHVHCKISGMVTEADLQNPQQSDLQPYVDHVLEVFGVHRLMFGGDYPVLELASTAYPQWVSMSFKLLDGLSDDEKARVFSENANAFYGL
ncbi:MAG: amidohydrolase family protein [Chloroflexota bacterium]